MDEAPADEAAMGDGKEDPILLADIGGTNARFALGSPGGEISQAAVLPGADHQRLADAAKFYLNGLDGTARATPRPTPRPRRAAIAVASPVTGDRVSLTNRAWSFSTGDLRRELGLDELRVINDFAAAALAVPRLAPSDLFQVGGGAPRAEYPIAVIGPGTGLGVSALIHTKSGWMPLATEGGHVTQAAANDREAAVIARLRQIHGHVSAERVISGPGLVNLYQSLCQIDELTADAALGPAEIVSRAIVRSDPVCGEAMDMFQAMLGTAASNAALGLDARGGVYIAGGIVPRLGQAFAASPFRRRFEDKGRYAEYLAAIPTYVITRKMPALLGLLAMMEDERKFPELTP